MESAFALEMSRMVLVQPLLLQNIQVEVLFAHLVLGDMILQSEQPNIAFATPQIHAFFVVLGPIALEGV